MSTSAEIHMGEIIAMIVKRLADAGLRPRGEISFRYITARSRDEGKYTYINTGGSYLTAICETEPLS